jgi:hypothetical protein
VSVKLVVGSSDRRLLRRKRRSLVCPSSTIWAHGEQNFANRMMRKALMFLLSSGPPNLAPGILTFSIVCVRQRMYQPTRAS